MRPATSFLGTRVRVTVDRPLGSSHPEWGFVYPLNYGYIEGIRAPDGEFLDAYILGVSHAVDYFEGRCVAVIHRTDDQDDKLVVVPPGGDLTDEQIRQATHFQEQFFNSIILRGPAWND